MDFEGEYLYSVYFQTRLFSTGVRALVFSKSFLLLTLFIAESSFTTPTLAAQTASVTGRVTESATGRPLQGARVSVSGSSVAAITDRTGGYRINGSFAADIVVRVVLLGFVPAEKRVPQATLGTPVDFQLVPRALGLDEVVVTGSAGPTRVREVGHSIAQIDPSRIPEAVISIDNMLAGKVPGLVVVPNSAMAGSGAQIRLRGITSVSLSNQPLVYLDGVRIRSDGYPKNLPRTGTPNRGVGDVPSPLNDIDPEDVERVEVVRGPAATTLYGTEAATGVIQIFTKRGAAGRPLWNSKVVFGLDRVQRFGTDSEPYMRIDPWLKTARRTGYSVSAGGGDDLRYYVSAGYDRNEGVLPNDLERRLILRGNFDFAPAERLTLAWSSSVARNEISNTSGGFNAQGLVFNAYRGDKNFTGVPGKESIDRILAWDLTTSLFHFIGGLTATYRMGERMSHAVTIGYDRAEDEMRSLRPYGFVFAPQGILWADRWAGSTVTADYLGRSSFRIGAVGATLAWGAQTTRNEVASVAGYAEGFPGPGNVSLSSGALSLSFENRARGITSGGFSQIVLDLRDRYFLTAGLRLDGSSSFGSDFGLQPYPRLSASYVISDEPFWPRWLGEVKLRAAYGHAGRSPRTFDAVRTWSPSSYEGKPAFLPLTIGNAELGPERTAETEIGFDAGNAESRARADFTLYRRRTRHALLPVAQPPSLGFIGTQLENVGSLLNTGAELALSGSILRGATVTLDAGLDVALSRSRVVTLGNAASFIIDQTAWVIAGQPLLLVRGSFVKNAGELAEPVVEKDHDFGPNFPTRTIGLRGTLGVGRGIELATRVEYSGGNYMFDQASNNLARQGAWPVCDAAYKRIATGEREMLTAWQRLWCNPLTVPRDGSIYPADFVRLRALTLTMPLPGGFFRTRRGTIALSARNYLLWKHKDFLVFDPEMVGFDGMDATVRQIDNHVPAPAGVTLSIRASYW
jgi:outer membrane receptor protein involved in Fe transport